MDSASKLSSGSRRRRLPEASADGIDVNFCRNPLCSAFGVRPYPYDLRGRRNLPKHARDHRVNGASDSFHLRCNVCGSTSTVKNNNAISEELARLELLFCGTKREPGCPRAECENYFSPLQDYPHLYRKAGKTAGSRSSSGKQLQRWQCKTCKATFTLIPPAHRHQKSHLNGRILELVTGKMPLSKLVKRMDISFPALYDKIDFLAEQCRRLMADRESRISDMPPRYWRLSTDRQDINVNWPTREARAGIVVGLLVTADQSSGYVLGIHSQFDSEVDPDEHEAKVQAEGDLHRRKADRRYGRLWTAAEYARSLRLDFKRNERSREAVRAALKNEFGFVDEDLPDLEVPTPDRQLPHRGALVHLDVLQYAHMLFLRRLLGESVASLLFSVDEDAGLKGACISAFQDLIKRRRAHIAMVTFNKEANSDEKRAHAAVVGQRLKPHREALPLFPKWLVEELLLANSEEFRGLPRDAGQRAQHLATNWFLYPFSTKAEPEKRVKLLTGGRGLGKLALARRLRLASLHPSDRIMMMLRRSSAGLERGISTPRNDDRIWSLYAPYDPAMVQKLATLNRFYLNYVEIGKDGKTPAMRLGLAKGRIYHRDLLRF